MKKVLILVLILKAQFCLSQIIINEYDNGWWMVNGNGIRAWAQAIDDRDSLIVSFENMIKYSDSLLVAIDGYEKVLLNKDSEIESIMDYNSRLEKNNKYFVETIGSELAKNSRLKMWNRCLCGGVVVLVFILLLN